MCQSSPLIPSSQVREYGFEDELLFADNPESNNIKPAIAVSFCGFGVYMHAGTGMQVGRCW